MQRTWWPDAGTIIVTGPYWMVTIPHPETVVIQRESSAIQCAYNLDPGVHWNATGERSVSNQWVSSISPTCFQWSSTVFPSCKLPLDCNWGTIGESMSQCGSTVVCSVVSQYASGLPFFCNYGNQHLITYGTSTGKSSELLLNVILVFTYSCTFNLIQI